MSEIPASAQGVKSFSECQPIYAERGITLIPCGPDKTPLVKNPQNRSEVVRKSIENLGGKLVGAWMAFGDHDVVFIVDMPDTISAAAMALSVGAGGALKGTKTTLLISLDEGVEALKKASSSGYTPVQK